MDMAEVDHDLRRWRGQRLRGVARLGDELSLYQLRVLLRVHPSIGKHDYPGYNLSNLLMTSDKQTIEFRKMEATIDALVVDASYQVRNPRCRTLFFFIFALPLSTICCRNQAEKASAIEGQVPPPS